MKLLIGAGLIGVAMAVLGPIVVLPFLPVEPRQARSPAPLPSPVVSPSATDWLLASPTATISPTIGGAATGIDIGQLAPDVALQSLDGKTIYLSDFRVILGVAVKDDR